MKSLHELIQFLDLDMMADDVALQGLFIDSRAVTPNSVFVAVQGEQHHGLEFVDKAIEQGAVLVLTDRIVENQNEIPQLFIEDLNSRLPQLAKWFYQDPSSRLKVIGITGTNGKTSSAHYLAQLLNPHANVAVMGTLGNGLLGELKPSPNTTLETLALNHLLNEFVQQQVEYVVMEVSSHAVALQRIAGLQFEVLALTQVTRDHLDFHQTEQAYREVKKSLFLEYPAQHWVLNTEDAMGLWLAKNAQQPSVIGYAKQLKSGVDSTLYFQSVNYDVDGFSGACFYQAAVYPLRVSLMGVFNVENLLCALGCCQALGFSWQQLEDTLVDLKPVAGRMQIVHQSPTVLIDYAHTPDALHSLLVACKQHLSNSVAKLWLVFGCGGDRDQGKRPLMGKVAQSIADQVVITDDNPRYEDPRHIVEQILEGMTTSPVVIHNRSQAVQFVVEQAQADDMIVIAGKGHEDYQDIQGVKYPLQDAVLVERAFNQTKHH